MLRYPLEEEMHDVALLTPPAEAVEDHNGPLERYQSRLKTSSAYIQQMLGNIRTFENKQKIIKYAVYTSASLTLLSAYFAYIYACANTQFISSENSLVIGYQDTRTNGTTCGKLFPIANKLCSYLNTQSPLAFYCANLLREILLPLDYHYNRFLSLNCFTYFPGIDLANITGMSAALVQCLGYVTEHSTLQINYSAYLNSTVILNGTKEFCNSILPFSNEAEYNAAALFNNPQGFCWSYLNAISNFYDGFNTNYHRLLNCNSSCAINYPLLNFNFSQGMQNIYNAIPNLQLCYEKAQKTCLHRSDSEYDEVTINAKIGLIFLFIGMGLTLLFLTYLLSRYIKKTYGQIYYFKNLSLAEKNEINGTLATFYAGNPADDLVKADNTLVETQQALENIDKLNAARLEDAMPFLAPAKDTLLQRFFARDANADVTDNILKHAELKPVAVLQRIAK